VPVTVQDNYGASLREAISHLAKVISEGLEELWQFLLSSEPEIIVTITQSSIRVPEVGDT
jgi:hypothetical protein